MNANTCSYSKTILWPSVKRYLSANKLISEIYTSCLHWFHNAFVHLTTYDWLHHCSYSRDQIIIKLHTISTHKICLASSIGQGVSHSDTCHSCLQEVWGSSPQSRQARLWLSSHSRENEEAEEKLVCSE